MGSHHHCVPKYENNCDFHLRIHFFAGSLYALYLKNSMSCAKYMREKQWSPTNDATSLIFYLYFRFGGEKFPPFIMYKIFFKNDGHGNKYFSGKDLLKPSSKVMLHDRCIILILLLNIFVISKLHSKYTGYIISPLVNPPSFSLSTIFQSIWPKTNLKCINYMRLQKI